MRWRCVLLLLAVLIGGCGNPAGLNPDAIEGTEAHNQVESVDATTTTNTTNPVATTTTVNTPVPKWQLGSSDYLYDQQLLHTFELTIPEEALAEIDSDPSEEIYVEGSLTFEGETVSPVGIRYKGSIGAWAVSYTHLTLPTICSV